jgi:thiamine-phosphate pyrophosphorylase
MDPKIARILDANADRVREAARVMEDYARFALDDQPLVAAIKQLRHDFTAVVGQLPADELIAARNTPGDLGTTLATEGERKRSTSREVVTAASRRCQEALRSLEEYGKLVSPVIGEAFERLRYQAYDLERRLSSRRTGRSRLAEARLHVLLTAELCQGDWLATAEAAIEGGADALQLREKKLANAELLARAERLRELTSQKGVVLVINDRPDIARLVQADGVHLGQDDLPVPRARVITGPDIGVGKSTHNLNQLQAAIAEQPDIVAFGPIYQSQTKPQDHVPGLAGLRAAAATCPLPIIAIGGIEASTAGEVIAAGAHAVAVCQAVIAQPEPAAAARAIRDEIKRAVAKAG